MNSYGYGAYRRNTDYTKRRVQQLRMIWTIYAHPVTYLNSDALILDAFFIVAEVVDDCSCSPLISFHMMDQIGVFTRTNRCSINYPTSLGIASNALFIGKYLPLL